MKRSLIFSFIVAAALSLTSQAYAAVEVGQLTEAEYVVNNGYSEAVAEDIFVEKNRTAGRPIEPLYPRSNNVFVKFCRALYGYTDPTIDTYDRVHHNIKLSPSWSDL